MILPKKTACLAALLSIVWGCGNGENNNPNACHASAERVGALTSAEAKKIDLAGYEKLLKATRPELSDAERHEIAVRTFKLRQP